MKRKKDMQSSWIRVFYYSHPYLVIFNLLIIYNLILIALASWLMTWLMANNSLMDYSWTSYLKNLEYCTVFTMNTGGIYDDAPNTVIVMKIILSVLQMITFTGALIGLATSMLQNVFDKRAHNVGRLNLKNHFVILNWSPAAANLIRELSFLKGRKTVVVLSTKSRDEINDEIDNVFLETATNRKNITVFVKQGNPGSRKALKEISISKAKSITLLVPSDKVGNTTATDVDTFKLLMGIIGITKKASITIEAQNESIVKSIEELIKNEPELSDLKITTFSRGNVVGHILARCAINSSYADLYCSMLTYQNGGFYEVPTTNSLEESMKQYNNCIPVSHYVNDKEEILYALAASESKTFKSLRKKDCSKEIPYKKNLNMNSLVLFVIGENDRTKSIIEEAKSYTDSNLGRIDCKIYPFDFDTDALIEDIKKLRRRKRILILSDQNASTDNVDANVFMTLLKLKASHKLPEDVEISAELLDQSNKSSLASLNITNVIISNQMVALYLLQLMTHPDNTSFYTSFLSGNSDYSQNSLDIDVRYAEEILDFKDTLEFSSKGELIQSLYKASNYEYIPIGFVDEKKKKESITKSITNVVGKTITSVVDITKTTVSNITDMSNALNIDEMDQKEVQLDVNSRITLLSDKIFKNEKITVYKGMIIILIHNRELLGNK